LQSRRQAKVDAGRRKNICENIFIDLPVWYNDNSKNCQSANACAIILRRALRWADAACGRPCPPKTCNDLRAAFAAGLCEGRCIFPAERRPSPLPFSAKARTVLVFCVCPKFAPRLFLFSIKGCFLFMLKKISLPFFFLILFFGGSAFAEEKLDRRGAEEWIAVAEREIYAQKYANAINSATNAVVLNPKLDKAFFLRGVGYASLGIYHQAIHEFAEAIRLNPNNGQYYAWRASSLTERRIYDEAIEDFDKAISLNPNSAAIYQRRGFAYSLMERHAEAIADFDRALGFNVKDYWSYYQKAEACYALGLKQEALDSYKSFLQHAPSRLRQSYRDMAQSRISELEKA
jgi:Tfp pilus assembly protein PilF